MQRKVAITESKWNGLKVTWGLNPFSSFQDVPRTKADALHQGWVKKDAGAGCQGAHFNGERFWKDSDLGVILLYDVNGFIAGIQTAFDKNTSPNQNNYPAPQMQTHPLVEEGGNYHSTAYFIPSDTVCTTGRTEADFHQEGTGTGLWVQNGTTPSSTVQIPMTIEQARTSAWTEGKCFASMGKHFWYNLSKGMDCNDFFPMFLLYNGGVLNGFGWAYGIDITASSRLEHPPAVTYAQFMAEVPTCLGTWGTLTTLHIYLTDSALADTC
ncbi:hypothetical protein MAR_015203 [Mya arenaria]|uniref:Uncharacterized protein n=1 Tax=Mya arenaria TaxID=6604 RepID=A0ABY7FK34_MYAAR|nr:hypothetical protein MAR_015203 [Mya arenaria]